MQNKKEDIPSPAFQSRFIGIPYEFNGDTFDSCDCIGLARLFYKEHQWDEDFSDGLPINALWYHEQPFRLLFYLYKRFDKTTNFDELRYGDLIYFRILGEGHIGIYTAYGTFISIMPTQNTFFGGVSFKERISNFKYITNRPVELICGFKRRD